MLCASAWLWGCSPPPEASPRPGGGATGTFEGHLTVFVLGADSERVADAVVRAGDLEATTNEEGRVDFDLDGYDGVEVSHGSRAERWFGLQAAVVTVPIERDVVGGSGTLSGMLELGGLLPADPANHLSAVVAASHTRQLDRNAPSAAVRCPDANDCAFTLTAPPSSRRVFAEVLERDAEDEVVAVRGLFLSAAREVVADQTTAVELLPVDAPVPLEVALPSGAEGFDEVVGVPGATLDGAVLVFSEEAAGHPRLLPPGSSAIWAVAVGRSGRSESRSVVRTASATTSLRTPALSQVPDAAIDDDTITLPEANYRVLRAGFDTVRVFDARVRVPRPVGDEVRLEITDVDMSPTDVSLDAIETDWVHRVRTTL
ncbi:MAG: hypothetical protein AB8I08_12655 [Sandaracinaceae bacterium]